MRQQERATAPLRRRRLVLAAAACAALAKTSAADTAPVQIGYLRWQQRRPTISLLDKPAADDGLAGAMLALEDNNTTGRFMGQQFALLDARLRPGDDAAQALGAMVARNVAIVLTDAPAATVLRLADLAQASGITLFNTAAPDDALREQDCRANVIHVAPSRTMLADALGQYLAWKKWRRWLLLYGSHPEDLLLADAYRRTAKRFGATIVEARQFTDTGGARQTDSGLAETQSQIPVLTQSAPEYDVLVAADENQVFAGYLPYRTWDARPVAGSAGLIPTSWDPSSESWGGAQLQDRFTRLFHRHMTALDLQVWTAMRMVGEGASRARTVDPRAIIAYIKGPDFDVAAYKGQKLTLRDWNWQLRQPILLSDGRDVVSVSPQPGFLHQFTELDTLGIDRPETGCKLK